MPDLMSWSWAAPKASQQPHTANTATAVLITFLSDFLGVSMFFIRAAF
jgi:hypothetical protein